MPAVVPSRLVARQVVRQQGRHLLRHPGDENAHMARLHAALELPGGEPAQGALADLFSCFGAQHETLKRTALQLARSRLSAHAARWFDAQAAQAALPAINPLATRCSVDDSRLLAEHAVLAFERGDASAQNEFLHHCVTCHDNLAFMLARRALLKTGISLPSDWAAVSLQLEQPREFI